MVVLVINILLISGYSVLYNFVKDKRIRFLFFILSCVQILMIVCLRKDTVGTDIVAYKAKFRDVYDMPFSSIFYRSNYPITIRDLEMGFVILTKILCIFGNNLYIYLSILSLIIFVPIFIVIYKLSDNPPLSLFLFISLQFMNFCASGLRQALAFSMCFLAFFFLLKKRHLLVLLFIFLAFSFHKSSLVFLLVFLLPCIKWKSKTLIVFMGLFLSLFVLKDYLYNTFSSFFGYSAYGLERTNSFGLLLFSFFVFAAGYLFLEKNNRINICFISSGAFSSLFMIFTMVGNNSARIGFYFFILNSIIITKIVASSKNTFNKYFLTCSIVVLGLIFYFLKTMTLYSFGNYQFLWE